MCQSAACSAMRSANTSASAWVPPRTWSVSRAPGSSIGAPIHCPQPSGVNHRLTGSSAAPVFAASSAGPPGIFAASPKNCTSMPLRDRSRSATRQIAPPARRRAASTSEGVLCPPVSGSTSMPRLSRYATKRSNSDSGLSRSATVVNG